MKRIGLYIVTTSVLSKQDDLYFYLGFKEQVDRREKHDKEHFHTKYLCIEMPLVFLIYVYAAHEAYGETLFCALRVKYQPLMSNDKPIAPQT